MPPAIDNLITSVRQAIDSLPEHQARPSTDKGDVQANAAEGSFSWMQETTLHPFAMLILIGAVLVIFFGRRRHAVMAYLFVACFVSGAQNLNFLGTSLYLLRILVLCGSLRCLLRSEWSAVKWSLIDTFTLAWAIVGVLAYVAQRGEAGALIFKAGMAIDSAAAYFVLRCLLQTRDDIRQAIVFLGLAAIPISIMFLFEHATSINLFSIFGGVPEITAIRQGRLRCQGAFSHPILAGVFWSAILPTFLGLALSGKSRIVAALGSVSCLMIIYACASSTPILGVAAGLAGLVCFYIRQQMRWVQLGTVGLLCGMHLTMKAPVWHLLARVDILGGSTGHYRFMLVDATIRFFSEWWLVGLISNEHWGKYYGHYLTDITNQYVLEGLRGGLVTLLMFVLMIWAAYRKVGTQMKRSREDGQDWLLWSLGVALFVHCGSFMAVSYFGQSILLFHLHLAMIASLPSLATANRPVLAFNTLAHQRSRVRNRPKVAIPSYT